MRIGTRRSALALAQAEQVARLLGDAEIVPIVTSGDRGSSGDDKSRWVRELEAALAAEEVDLAVHSAKDLPAELPAGLELLGAPARAPAQDVLCGARSLAELPSGARVGTSSVRRRAQLLAARPDLEPVALHGNVDTRLRKLDQGEPPLAAVVLARAGLERLGLAARVGGVLAGELHVPAPGQGALALEGRAGDLTARAGAERISDSETFACLLAERALARELGASCHTPLGATAVASGGGRLRLHAWIGLPDGSAWASDELAGNAAAPEALGREVAARLRQVGAAELLAQAEEMAATR